MDGLMKFGTNVPQVSRHYWKGFSRSEVKGQGHDQTECYILAEACISTVWSRGL